MKGYFLGDGLQLKEEHSYLAATAKALETHGTKLTREKDQQSLQRAFTNIYRSLANGLLTTSLHHSRRHQERSSPEFKIVHPFSCPNCDS